MTDAVIDRASGIGDAAAEPQVDVAQGYGTKGAVPGAISVVVFTALHHVTIKQHLADARRHAGAGFAILQRVGVNPPKVGDPCQTRSNGSPN